MFVVKCVLVRGSYRSLRRGGMHNFLKTLFLTPHLCNKKFRQFCKFFLIVSLSYVLFFFVLLTFRCSLIERITMVRSVD